MIVWGGTGGNNGGFWTPFGGGMVDGTSCSVIGGCWEIITATGAPGNYMAFSAVWADSQFIVWGGTTALSNINNTGGILKPHYLSTASISNLKLNADSKATWDDISWNGSEPLNTNIKFRIRGAASEAELSGAEWSGFYETTPAPISTAASQWLEIEMTLETSDGLNTPTLNDFSITYDAIDAPNSPKSFRTDGTTEINLANTNTYTNETSIIPKATIPNMQGLATDGSIVLAPEIELRTDANFTDSPGVPNGVTFTPANHNYTGEDVDVSFGTISGLTNNSTYYWKIRFADNSARASAWSTNYSSFTIEQTAPTITSFNIDSGVTYTKNAERKVTLNSNVSDTGGSNLAQMRFANEDLAWSNWETYAAARTNWILSANDGTKTVYAQYKDNAGNVSGVFLHGPTNFSANLPATMMVENDSLRLVSYYRHLGLTDDCWDGGSASVTVPADSLANQIRVYWNAANEHGPTGYIEVPIGGTHRTTQGDTGWLNANSVYGYVSDDNYDCDINLSVDLRDSTLPAFSVYTSTAIPNPGMFTTINWSDVTTSPNTGTVTMKVIGGDDSNMANPITSSNLNKGDTIPENIQSKAYLKYQLTMSSGNGGVETPLVYSVEVQTLNADSITLDTQAPTAFTLSSPINPTYSNSDSNPTFAWGSSSGQDKYQFVINNVVNKDNLAADATSTTASTPFTEGSYSWTIRAVDGAGNETNASNGPFTYVYDTTAPDDVTGLTAPKSQSTIGTIQVNWAAVTDTSGIDHYRLERKRADDDWTGSLYGTYATYDVTDTFKVDTGLEVGRRYNYRIKAYDRTGLVSSNYAYVDGFTIDTLDPTAVTAIALSPCDGTEAKCSNVANKGYEIKITWNKATDYGVGVTGYKIYRSTNGASFNESDFSVVGYIDVIVPGSEASSLTYYDNDANNEATFTDTTYDPNEATEGIQPIKVASTARLNDYVSYYYRINAIDESGNEMDVINPLAYYDNYGYTNNRTVDVTNPTTPADLTATPTGVDTLNNEPLTQGVAIAWSASTDTRTPGRVPTGNGSGISRYSLSRAAGNINGPTESFAPVTGATNLTSTSFTNEGLAEDSYYYYKIYATDNSTNVSELSDYVRVRTRNSQVPSTPSAVIVTAKTGNPNTDVEVGYKVTVSFNGSKIKVAENRVDGYRVYRATTNYDTPEQWLALTPVHDFANLNIAGEVQDGNRNFIDTVPDDATTYFYRIIAYGFNVANNEIVESSLTTPAPGTLHAGWDTTPDAKAPNQPGSLTVKDMFGDGLTDSSEFSRVMVSWQALNEGDSLRKGASDFDHYELKRYYVEDGVTYDLRTIYQSEQGNRSKNYYVDTFNQANYGRDYYYYVVAVDNANTWNYSIGGVINAVANISDHVPEKQINPAEVTVTISSQYNIGGANYKTRVTSQQVASGIISWTTDRPADSLVEYRRANTDDKYIAAGDTELRYEHSVKLAPLESNTQYEYRIRSMNSVGNVATASGSDVVPFSTLDFSIGDPRVEDKDITTTGAIVRWSTPIEANSFVEFTPEGSQEKSKIQADSAFVLEHDVQLFDLKPNTKYLYQVRSITEDNYPESTGFLSFTTKSYDSSQFTIAPNASNVAEENITATTAKIVWNTAVSTVGCVQFDTAPLGSREKYPQESCETSYNTVHVITLENLTPGKTYYYRVTGTDVNLTLYTSKEYSFTAVLKPEIQGLKLIITSSYTAKIVFNTNVDTNVAVTYGKDGALDLKAGNSDYKRNHEIELKNLEDNSSYTYYVEVRDKLENGQRSQTASFATPIDKEGPKVENLKIDMLPMGESDESAQVIISWNSSKPSSTKIEYDEGMISGKYGKSTIEDSSLSTSHTVIIKDLNPSSTYHFRVAGQDKRGNMTESEDYNFVTPEKNKSVWQLIVRSLEETFAWVKDVGGFFKNIGQKAQ